MYIKVSFIVYLTIFTQILIATFVATRGNFESRPNVNFFSIFLFRGHRNAVLEVRVS